MFSCGGKKSLQRTKTLAPPPPPHISNGSSLTPERLNYVTVFSVSVKAMLPWKLQLRLEIQVQCRMLNIF